VLSFAWRFALTLLKTKRPRSLQPRTLQGVLRAPRSVTNLSATRGDQRLGSLSFEELYGLAVLEGNLEAQYELARLEEEEREAEAEEIFSAEEYARREREQWHYFDVVCMRRHLPSFNYRRPIGRERRVACNHRRRGSRRVTRAGPSSDDDPPGEPDPELAVGGRR
jgi:hypothetical protein